MFCTNCGLQLDDTDHFCRRCGGRVGGAPRRPLMLDKKNQKIAGVCAGFARYWNMDLTPEDVVANLDAINDETDYIVPTSVADAGTLAPPPMA